MPYINISQPKFHNAIIIGGLKAWQTSERPERVQEEEQA